MAAWAHKNRKRLITIAVIVVAVAVIFGGYYLYENGRETAASEALSDLKQPMTPAKRRATAVRAQPYLKVADEYSGTSAAARALLIGGGIMFDAGKFDQAKAEFDKFLGQYPEQPAGESGAAWCRGQPGSAGECGRRYFTLRRIGQAACRGLHDAASQVRAGAVVSRPKQTGPCISAIRRTGESG